MAETDTEDRTETAGHHGLSLTQKWHGVPVWGWVVGGTIGTVFLVRWWKNRHGAAGAGTSAASTSTGASTVANCYDITGALVPCQQAAANNAGASGYGGVGGVLGGIYGTTSTTTSTGGATGGGTTTSTGTSTTPTGTGKTTSPVTNTGWKFPAPTGLHANGAGKGTITVGWNPVTGPQGQKPKSYTVAYGRTSGAQTWKVVTVDTTTALTTQPGMTEYIEVWANGGPVAPPHAGPTRATAGK